MSQRNIVSEPNNLSPIERLAEAGLLELRSSSSSKAKTLALQVYDNLHEALLSGVLSAGDHLNIRPMAEAFGTSTMPVRDAMTRLAGDSVLAALANRAFVVPRPDQSQLRELTLIRVRLESLVAEHAATRQTIEGLQNIEAIYQKMCNPESPASYLADHRAFHFAIYASANMPIAFSMIESTWLRMGPVMKKTLRYVDLDEENEAHGRILTALQMGKPNEAAIAVADDLRLATANTQARLLKDVTEEDVTAMRFATK